MGKKTPKTRACNTLTEAAYWSKIRSILRQGMRYWKPITECKKQAKRKYTGNNSKQKWEYQCANCKGWFADKETSVDHIIPCGSLKSYEDLPDFVRKLTCEIDGLQVLCKPCHNDKTQSERRDND
jgi:5-methylcytosine-specific restriction endonuclease McrA